MAEYRNPNIFTGGNDIKKVWFVYYDFKDPSTGRYRRFKEKRGINRIKKLKDRLKFAEALRDIILQDLKEGYNPFTKQVESNPLSEMLLPEVVDHLFEVKKKSLRKASRQQYTYSNNLLKAFLEKRRKSSIYPKEFTPVMAQEFCDHLIIEKGYGNKTFNSNLTNMKTVFNEILNRDLITKNPFRAIKPKPLTTGKNVPFTNEQKEKIRKHLTRYNPNLLLFCKFIYHCYTRPNELVQLKVSNLDLTSNRLMIPANISKNRKQSAVEIPDTFIKEVKEVFKNQPEENYLFGKHLNCTELPIIRNRVSEMHGEVLRLLKITGGQTMYSWKHTGVITAFKSGVDIYDLMRQLRHHSLDQTADYLKSLGLMPNVGFKTKAPKF